jgi:hypothetical protein
MLLTVMSLLAVVCSGDEVGEANAQTTGAQTKTQNIAETPATMDKVNITIGGVTKVIELVDNAATKALVGKLQEKSVTVTLNTNSNFEIWGSLGFSLPTSDEYINGQPGDVVLYNGSNICLFYGSNSYSYTRLGKINGLTADELKTFLKGGQNNISVTLSLPGATAVKSLSTNQTTKGKEVYYTLNGLKVDEPRKGIYIVNGEKRIVE